MRTIVLAAAVALMPAVAWGQVYTDSSGKPDENANEWRQQLDADIRGGADPESICIKAKSKANWARSTAFKDWAYGIANQYCNMPEPSAGVSGNGDSTPKAATPTPEQPQFVNGVMVRLCSHGMPCLGQLKRAMGVWE